MAPSTVERSRGLKVTEQLFLVVPAVPAVVTGGPSGSSVEAQGVVLFLSSMPLGRKYLAVFTDVAAWLFCTGFLRELVKDFAVSLLFLLSWLVAKNLSLVKWLQWKHSSVRHDGEPSWFLLAWSSAVKVAQALTNYVLPGRCKTRTVNKRAIIAMPVRLGTRSAWCGQRLTLVPVLLGNLEGLCASQCRELRSTAVCSDQIISLASLSSRLKTWQNWA